MEESNLNCNLLSKLLSEKLGRSLQITAIEKMGSGYHSDGYKATSSNGETFFLKRFKSNDLGFAYPERKVFSLLVSHSMAKRISKKPKPIGVILVNKNEASIIPEINENTDIYHIQEFESGGKDYFKSLNERKNKLSIDETDKEEVRKIVEYISSVHSVKFSVDNLERKKEVYNDGIRAILNSPELTLMILHDFDENYSVINREKQKEYLGLMYDVMHKWKNRSDRLCALHGDFWGANLFFKEDGSIWVIDYSRIPWGDPGIDIGWWLSQYLWLFNMTKNNYFKELGEFFIKEYENKSGDKEIRKAVTLSLGFLGLVNIFPRFYPSNDSFIGISFINLITNILQTGELQWE